MSAGTVYLLHLDTGWFSLALVRLEAGLHTTLFSFLSLTSSSR